jgi:hypothetical protein
MNRIHEIENQLISPKGPDSSAVIDQQSTAHAGEQAPGVLAGSQKLNMCGSSSGLMNTRGTWFPNSMRLLLFDFCSKRKQVRSPELLQTMLTHSQKPFVIVEAVFAVTGKARSNLNE